MNSFCSSVARVWGFLTNRGVRRRWTPGAGIIAAGYNRNLDLPLLRDGTGWLWPRRRFAKTEFEDIRPVVMARNVEGHFLAIDRGKVDIGDDRRLAIEDGLHHVSAIGRDDGAATAQDKRFFVSGKPRNRRQFTGQVLRPHDQPRSEDKQRPSNA